jgi:hypothetical protein
MHFRWVKGNVALEENELVDRLAIEAAVEDGPEVYDKIRREDIITREKEIGLYMCQQQWKREVTKAFFPVIKEPTTKR